MEGHRRLEMMRELEQMPERRLWQEIYSVRYSLFTFDGNFEDFQRVIQGLSSHPRADELLWVRNRDQLESYLMHIGRLLHNFVAAAQSLVDHTRNVYTRLNVGPTGISISARPFPAYSEMVAAEFANDPLTQFIQRLRVYCQHYRLPAIGFRLEFDNVAGTESRSVELSKSELLQFDGWSSLAKRFLANLPDDIDILSIGDAYRRKVLGFYEWFIDGEREIFREEIGRLMNRQADYFRLTLELEIDACLAGSSPFKQPEDVFLNLFTSHDFDALDRLPPGSEARRQLALTILESHFPISDDLRNKVIALFAAQNYPPSDQDTPASPSY